MVSWGKGEMTELEGIALYAMFLSDLGNKIKNKYEIVFGALQSGRVSPERAQHISPGR